jgi:hypothetical protein
MPDKIPPSNLRFDVPVEMQLVPKEDKSRDPGNVRADDIQAGGKHYKEMTVQPWHVMESVLTREEFIGYLKGNVIKYGMRQGKKDSPDAEKCIHYRQKLDEVLNGNS